jgi:hypothetical protein
MPNNWGLLFMIINNSVILSSNLSNEVASETSGGYSMKKIVFSPPSFFCCSWKRVFCFVFYFCVRAFARKFGSVCIL